MLGYLMVFPAFFNGTPENLGMKMVGKRFPSDEEELSEIS
jgi:hypothetical protein